MIIGSAKYLWGWAMHGGLAGWWTIKIIWGK